MMTAAHFVANESGPYVAMMSESIATLPEPENGRITKNSVSSLGMPRNENTGETAVVRSCERPESLNSSTAAKIATR